MKRNSIEASVFKGSGYKKNKIRDNDPKEHNVSFLGLTKREYFAGLAMQGLCAGRTEYENPMCDVKRAVELADLLLKELDKPISTTED